jgi:hypothetical protein
MSLSSSHEYVTTARASPGVAWFHAGDGDESGWTCA